MDKSSQSWKNEVLIGFDTETTGKYPFESEICEIAAVKYHRGEVIDQFQSFVAISRPMGEEVIKIHNITNEMLEGAPPTKQVIGQFLDFIEDGYLVAHHAPFDMGFIAREIDRYELSLPKRPVFCSSLLSRKSFPQSKNHKLQTLISFFNLEKGAAHRAFDDAKACLDVGIKCFEKVGESASIDQLMDYQGVCLDWKKFSIKDLSAHSVYSKIVKALNEGCDLQITYEGGSRPGQARTVSPIGLVRTPNGDFLVANDDPKGIPKRYMLNKIKKASL